jgi:type III secretory pathway component EscS
VVADWLLIAAVIGLVIAVFWAIGQVIDACIGVWRGEVDDE